MSSGVCLVAVLLVAPRNWSIAACLTPSVPPLRCKCGQRQSAPRYTACMQHGGELQEHIVEPAGEGCGQYAHIRRRLRCSCSRWRGDLLSRTAADSNEAATTIRIAGLGAVDKQLVRAPGARLIEWRRTWALLCSHQAAPMLQHAHSNPLLQCHLRRVEFSRRSAPRWAHQLWDAVEEDGSAIGRVRASKHAVA